MYLAPPHAAMRVSFLLATLAAGLCATAPPHELSTEKLTSESFELSFESIDATRIVARDPSPARIDGDSTDLTLCRQPHGKEYKWNCRGEWGQISPTCGFTDWCNTYLWPLKGMSICIEDGDLFWNVKCCIEGFKRSCGNKLPDTLHVHPPRSS